MSFQVSVLAPSICSRGHRVTSWRRRGRPSFHVNVRVPPIVVHAPENAGLPSLPVSLPARLSVSTIGPLGALW